MKDAIKGLLRRFWHFCYPAIVLCWGAEDYVNGMRDRKVSSAVLGVLFVILGLSMFYYESEKLRKEEKMKTPIKLGGYIYKWGENIGLSDHFITKDKGPDIFDASKSYPVTDESFLYDDPFSVIGRGAIKLDDDGVWADITIHSEPYAEALLDPEKREKFKLGFMVMNKKEDKETGEITKGYLMGIDVSEIGMEEIEYVHN